MTLCRLAWRWRERALALALSALSTYPLHAADSPAPPDPVADSARAHFELVRPHVAEPLLLRALGQLSARTRRDSLRLAQWTELLAEAQWRMGRSGPAADSIAERAVTLRRALHGRESAEVASALATQARVWRHSKSPARAADGLQAALSMRERFVAAPDTIAADMLISLGNLLRALNRAEDGVELLERSVAIRRAALGPFRREVARALLNLALTQGALGRYQDVIASEREAIEIFESALPPDSMGLYFVRKNHVSHLFTIERWIDAGPHLARWSELADQLYPQPSGERVDLEASFGVYYLQSGNRAESRRHFDRCGAILASTRVIDHSYKEGIYWLSRTSLEQADGNLDSASACAERALRSFKPPDGESPRPREGRAMATAYSSLGQIRARQDELPAADSALRHATTLYAQHLSPEHPDAAFALEELAAVRLRLGERDSASAAALRAAASLSRNVRRELAGMTEDEAIRYRKRGATLAIDVLLSLASDRADSALVRSVWAAVLQHVGLVATEITARQRLLSATRDTTLRRRAETLLRVRAHLGRLELLSRPDSIRDSLRAIAQGLEMQLAAASARLERDFATRELSGERVAVALSSPTRLVHFVRFARFQPRRSGRRQETIQATESLPRVGGAAITTYAAFVLDSAESSPRFIPLGPAYVIERELERWRSALAGGGAPTRAQWDAGRSLRKRVWDPLVPHLAGGELVLIVPDGQLALVPWATLPDSSGAPLLEHGPTLHLLNGARDLLREPPGSPPDNVLIVGGVDYDAKPRRVGEGGRAWPASRGRSSDCAELAPLHHEPLPGSSDEARRVARTWIRTRGGEPELLLGADATEHRVRTALPGRGLAHLATHGYFVPDSCVGRGPDGDQGNANPLALAIPWITGEAMLRSGLVLAGANGRSRDSADDGILTAADLALLDLERTRLVVLSACESGHGMVVNAEGVVGLRWALMQAGVRATLTASYRVSDEASSRWMELFYEAWLADGRSVPEAVRAASRGLRREIRERTGEDRPGAWGAFVSAGDWR